MDNILLLSTSEVNTWDGVEGSALAPIFSSKIGLVENSSDNCKFWTIFLQADFIFGVSDEKIGASAVHVPAGRDVDGQNGNVGGGEGGDQRVEWSANSATRVETEAENGVYDLTVLGKLSHVRHHRNTTQLRRLEEVWS